MDDIDDQDWAFKHDHTIAEYLYKVTILDSPKEFLRTFSDYISTQWANPEIDDEVINEFMEQTCIK